MTRIRSWAPALGFILLVPVLAGCGTPAAASDPTSSPTGSESPSAESTPTTDPVEWVEYTVPSGLATFELPADWTAQVVGDIEVSLLDPDDVRRVTYLEQIGGIGGPNCEVPVPFQVLDSIEIPLEVDFVDPEWSVPPQVDFQIMEDGGGYLGTIGTTDSVAGLDGVTCGFMNVISSKVLGQFTFATSFQAAPGYTDEGPQLSFASVDEAQEFMDTDEYATLIRILTSIEIG